jgi:translation elongation factor EF-G
MAIILNASQEPDKSKPKIMMKVLVTVPEEFLGASQHEFEARQGWITSMEVRPGGVVIHATLPSGIYDELAEAIKAGTQGRGRIELTS